MKGKREDLEAEERLNNQKKRAQPHLVEKGRGEVVRKQAQGRDGGTMKIHPGGISRHGKLKTANRPSYSFSAVDRLSTISAKGSLGGKGDEDAGILPNGRGGGVFCRKT